jgi:hypothetical protein
MRGTTPKRGPVRRLRVCVKLQPRQRLRALFGGRQRFDITMELTPQGWKATSCVCEPAPYPSTDEQENAWAREERQS